MEVIAALGAWALSNSPMSRFLYSPNITAELGPLLSHDASIYLPGSAQFDTATDRYEKMSRNPGISIVVEVSNEEDIQATVRLSLRISILTYERVRD